MPPDVYNLARCASQNIILVAEAPKRRISNTFPLCFCHNIFELAQRLNLSYVHNLQSDKINAYESYTLGLIKQQSGLYYCRAH
ncbi:MAG: hypothetical protein PWP27_1590 [Clostridiales bacterium]|nr:hypothetical protein [Clostridiales bacterium]